jgi:PAS domain S-box-containing protein
MIMSDPIRTLTKEEAQKQADLLRTYTVGFDLLPLHVAITDVDGHILYANKAAEKNTGYVLDEMLGKNPGDLWGGNMDIKVFQEMWTTIKEKKECYFGKIKNKRKSGQVVWQRLYVCPVLNPKNEVLFFVGVEPDITAEVETEIKLQTSDKKLKNLLDAAVAREHRISDLKENFTQD